MYGPYKKNIEIALQKLLQFSDNDKCMQNGQEPVLHKGEILQQLIEHKKRFEVCFSPKIELISFVPKKPKAILIIELKEKDLLYWFQKSPKSLKRN